MYQSIERLVRYVPILGWLPRYRPAWLKDDAIAALSVWALLVPQGLAYAAIAGVPVQYGLYTAFAALIAYAIFGTARQVIQGPSATVAAVSTAVITPLVGAGALGTDKAAEWAAALALAAAAVYVALGVLRMGWVSNFLSKAVLGGFILGFAIGIVIDQAPKLFGVEAGDGTYFEDLIDLIKSIPDTALTTLAVGAVRWRSCCDALSAPEVAASAARGRARDRGHSALDLANEGVAITGEVPTGLFEVGLPGVGWSEAGTLVVGGALGDLRRLLGDARGGPLVSRKHGYEIDPDQELIAQGVACGAAGFVGGFVNDGSLSKTSVADVAGQRTQMASLINAAMVLLTMLFLASLFKDLPAAALGAVVIDAMVGLITFTEMKRYYRVNRPDWVFFIAAMAGILFFGIIAGIVIGVVLSLLLLIGRASKPGLRLLGKHPTRTRTSTSTGTRTSGDARGGRRPPRRAALLRRCEPVPRRVSELVEDARGRCTPSSSTPSPISQTDTDGADILIEIAGELESEGASLALARDRVLDRSISGGARG